MSLLEALQLSKPPAAAGKAGADAQAWTGAKTRYDAAFKGAIAWANTLGDADKSIRVEFATALGACDKSQQQAARLAASDPKRAVAMLDQATANVTTARAKAEDALAAAHKSGGSAAPAQGATKANSMADVKKAVGLDAGAGRPASMDPGSARAEALRLKPGIETAYRAAHAAHEKLLAEQAALQKEAAAEKGSARKRELADRKAELDEKVEAAGHRAKLALRDVEALSDTKTKDETYAEIVARQKKGGDVAEATTVDRHAHEGLPGEKKTTTTTVRVDKGVAQADRTVDTASIGPEGASVGRSVESERTTAGGTLKKNESASASVSMDGAKLEHKRSSEFESADGKKIAVERERSIEASLGAVKGSAAKTVTRRDGTSEATTVTGAAERGGGKATVSGGASVKKTDASGNESTVGVEKKRGILAGEGGYGVTGQNTASVTNQRKNGFQTNAKLSYGGNISCKVGEPKGEPPLYPLTLTVHFEASASAGTGYDKKVPDAKGKASLDAKFTAAATMEVTNHLPADKVEAYLASLKAASTGGKADATYHELVIVSTGAAGAWDVAKRMYLSGKPESAVGATAGDSASIDDEMGLEASAKGSVKVVKGEASVKSGSKSSTKLTRTETGGFDVERQREESEGISGGAGVDTGITGMMIKGGRDLKTKIGFLVTIEPAADPKGELLAEFLKCRSAAQQQAFIDSHKDQVTLKEMTRGSEEGKSSGVDANLGPLDISLVSSGRVSRTTKTGGDGALRSSEVVGQQNTGGSAGLGETLRVSDSRSTTVTSKRGGDGSVSLDIADKRSSSDLLGKAKRLVGLGADEPKGKKKNTGLAEDLAGGPEEEKEFLREVYGVRLEKADIVKIVERAGNDRLWGDAAWMALDRGGIDEYAAMRRAILSKGAKDPGFVADQLAAFVGSDKGRRADVLVRLTRTSGGGDVSVGKRTEFPKSIREHQKAYDELVLRGVAGVVAQKAKAEGAEAAGTWSQEQFKTLEAILQAVRLAEDFRDTATQAEMMVAINRRKKELLAATRKATGHDSEKEEADAARHDFQRTIFELQKFPELAKPRLEKMKDLLGSSNRLYNDNLGEGLAEMENLASLFVHWQTEYDSAAALGKQLGRPEKEWLACKPDLAEYQRMRKAAGL